MKFSIEEIPNGKLHFLCSKSIEFAFEKKSASSKVLPVFERLTRLYEKKKKKKMRDNECLFFVANVFQKLNAFHLFICLFIYLYTYLFIYFLAAIKVETLFIG